MKEKWKTVKHISEYKVAFITFSSLQFYLTTELVNKSGVTGEFVNGIGTQCILNFIVSS